MHGRCREILIQQIGGDVKGMIAVGRSLEFLPLSHMHTCAAGQWYLTIFMSLSRIRCPAGECKAFCREGAPHTPVAYIQPQFLQLFSHPRAAVALQAKTMLFTNMGQYHHIITLTPLVLCLSRLSCEGGATARPVIYDGQWRGADRSPLGHTGPRMSMVAPVFSIDLNGYMGFGPE
jgi:hypothetical protein